jgi:hypothetical protein
MHTAWPHTKLQREYYIGYSIQSWIFEYRKLGRFIVLTAVVMRSSTMCNITPCIPPTTAAPTSLKKNKFNKSFTRRTSGHCLGTFQSAKLLFDYTPLQTGSVSHYPPNFLLSLPISPPCIPLNFNRRSGRTNRLNFQGKRISQVRKQ